MAKDKTDQTAARGATLAIIIAVIAAQGNQPVYGLIALVPLIDTDPNFADNPWGENENTIGLTSDKLQRALDAAFRDEDPQFRDHWHNNPRKMPNDMIRKLPKMIMVSATLDILFPSQSDFKTRLQAQGVQLSSLEVDGLHQVKDLDRVTVAGREVRKYILQASRDFMKLAASPPDRGLAVVTRLQPEGAINRLKPYEVRRLEQL